tara:strand:- start:772 stop:1011 length:240 start_codon:yes stop_codon:yes gene_type:complete
MYKFNPLVDSFDDISTNDLEEKIVELQRKYFMTGNLQVQQQISAILDMYIEEARSRRAKSMKKDLENPESGLDNLINIS